MQPAASSITVSMFKLRNFLFLFAVLIMHWTLLRPAPADAIFMVALYFSVTLNPRINSKFIIYFLLLFVWTFSIYFSSIHVMGDPAVQFQLLAHTFVVLLGLTACFVAMSWQESNFDLFLKVYLVSCCLTACLGLIGFAGGVELFLWDGRARGLFDEPNAFGAFLLPGVLASMYLLSRRHGIILPLIALVLCLAGVVLSFSRAVIFSLVVVAPLYFLFLNRRNLAKAGAYFLIGLAVAAAVAFVAFFGFEGFQEKVFDRLTVAKEYDVGETGRYNRYLLSIPMILENPLGLGMLEIDKYFPEPVHNLFISSFLNYGWLAGLVWILLSLLSIKISFENYRLTQSPLCIWLSFSLLTQIPSALLQQVEHWRHLWMFLGLLWGFNVRNFPAREAEVGLGVHRRLGTVQY